MLDIKSSQEFQSLLEEIRSLKALLKEEYTMGRELDGLMDNADFIRTMDICARTAQTWRDEGKIAYSKIGKKIYYQASDIEAFLEKYRPGFTPIQID